MELTVEELYANRDALETALAAIPPLPLETFYTTLGNTIYIENSIPEVENILTIFVKYEGSSLFAFYITENGIPFTSSNMRDYLTPPIQQAVLNWFYAIQLQKMYRVAKARIATYKEELMAAAWHPKRVERLLVAGGFEALDD